MKQNLMTAMLALVMAVITAGALFGAMTIYEQDKFEESWVYYPAVIKDEIKPLYSEDFDMNSTEY